MNIALIFAGGTGTRMNSKARPKQFLELYGKPIIIHTVEYFERSTDIDEIFVVCIEEWIDAFKGMLKRYNIHKVRQIVKGDTPIQKSIYEGLKSIAAVHGDYKDIIVLIHDGVRPLISDKVIADNIESVRKYGSAITVSPVTETVITRKDDYIEGITDRNSCCLARAPQSFYFEQIYEVHNKAAIEGYYASIDSASLMMKYGYRLHTVNGPAENLKVTTPVDFYTFRALYEARENSQIFGL